MAQATYAVVIVTYNRELLLRECIRHVKAQTVPAAKIIIVNNASTDGTSAYLKELSENQDVCQIIECSENIGGAGGFARGLSQALLFDTDCILFIDDDAILSDDYMEKLLLARTQYPEYHAFAGSVIANGKIDTCHRRMLSGTGFFLKDCKESFYSKGFFTCDIVSFCGMVVDKETAEEIGPPHENYFIWHDDVEYSLRIRRYSRFLIVSNAVLNHKTRSGTTGKHPRRYEWRDYYAIRNRIWMVREHGSLFDQIVNFTDLFIRVIFRNWLFGLLKVDHYDWNYEKRMVRKAIHDSHHVI